MTIHQTTDRSDTRSCLAYDGERYVVTHLSRGDNGGLRYEVDIDITDPEEALECYLTPQ